jgi:hypothetical protein
VGGTECIIFRWFHIIREEMVTINIKCELYISIVLWYKKRNGWNVIYCAFSFFYCSYRSLKLWKVQGRWESLDTEALLQSRLW